MRTRMSLLIASLLVIGLLSLGLACSDDDDGSGDTSTPAIGATSSTGSFAPPSNGEANDRDDFVTTIEARLEQLETRLDEIESEVVAMTDDE